MQADRDDEPRPPETAPTARPRATIAVTRLFIAENLAMNDRSWEAVQDALRLLEALRAQPDPLLPIEPDTPQPR